MFAYEPTSLCQRDRARECALTKREEQHDDQMLYELLRCMKALSTSEVS